MDRLSLLLAAKTEMLKGFGEGCIGYQDSALFDESPRETSSQAQLVIFVNSIVPALGPITAGAKGAKGRS